MRSIRTRTENDLSRVSTLLFLPLLALGISGCELSGGERVIGERPAGERPVDPLATLRNLDPTAALSLQRGRERTLRFRGRLPVAAAEPSGIVRELLAEHGGALGARPGLSFDLIRSARVGRDGQGVVHRLQRLERGLPVMGGELIVGLDATSAVTFLRHAHPAVLPARTDRPISETAATAAASSGLLGEHSSRIDARVWVEGDRRHPGWHEAFRVVLQHAPGASPLSAWAFVAAGSGEVVSRIDRLAHAGPPCVPCDATADANCGRFFFQTPIEALDDPSLRNNDNVDAALSDCELTNLSSSTHLDGTWANTGPTADSGSRSTVPHDALRSTNQRRVDEVGAYFHADRAKRQLDLLGFPEVMDYSLGIDAHDDQVGNNAYYDPQRREMHFGESGVDYAQDADVVYHEYGHALQHDMVPGWGQSYEAGALGEGFGDYWAAGITDDSFATVLGPACTAAWVSSGFDPYDGSPGSGCLRWVDGIRRFPEGQGWEVHYDGEIWSGALWPLRTTLGGAVLDPIVLASHNYLSSGPEYIDAADALLAADRILNGGANAAAIHQAMFDRGLPRTGTRPLQAGMIFDAPYSCETGHDYQTRDYVECTFTQPGAVRIRFHFTRFETEADYDFVRISDGTYNEVEVLSGTLFGGGDGYSAPVTGDTIVARFFADPAVEEWGFAIDGVSYADPSCTVDADCDDGVFCNGLEYCDTQNFCRNQVVPGLDDGVSCTVDACDEASQSVSHTPDDGICSDGKFCTGPETCDAIADCQPSPGAIDPDDGIDCTQDVCVERNDEVVNLPIDADCSDGVFCNGAEVCDSTLGCVAGTPNVEDDGVSCTLDLCNEETGEAEHRVDDGLCDDGLFCNGRENCHAVFDCQAGVAPAVDDGVSCTVDSCDEGSGAVVNAPDDSVCSDGSYCNGAEICDPSDGCGPGEALVLDDELVCTVDACDEAAGEITHEADEDCDPVTGERVKGCGCEGSGTPSTGLAFGMLLLGLLAARSRSTIAD